MAKGEAVGDRDFEITEDVIEHLAEREGGFKRRLEIAGDAVGALADDEALDIAELAGEAEMGEHAVHAVGLLIDIFDEEDGAFGLNLPGGAKHGGDEREIAADERPRCDAGTQSAD